MSKVLPFPFLVQVWNGSFWSLHSLYDTLDGALFAASRLRVLRGLDACVFLDDTCVDGIFNIPCHV